MEQAKWRRMQQVFAEALDRPAAEREAFVIAACADDAVLAERVVAMLRADAAGTPTLDDGAGAMVDDLFVAEPTSAIDPAQFHPYRLLRPIGEGGMGVVYLAERRDLDMQVAVKILRDAWLSPARRERFVAEQRTLAQLAHPGIARLFDAHTLADGTPWFVMEYVEGVALTEYARQAGSSISQRMALFRAVCEAVQYAHEHGVIHRDLKPTNILVKPDGSVRLLDFGIAKQLEAHGEAGSDRTTVAFMTPAYAAPEQYRGEVAGAATDIYALGVILFELLAGELPFPHRTRHLVPDELRPPKVSSVARRRGEAPRLADIASAAWGDLDTICDTCMAEEPAQRYRSVASLMRDLDHFNRHEPLEARPTSIAYRSRKWVRRRWRGATAALALVAGGSAAGLVFSSAREPVVARVPTVAVLPFKNVSGDTTLDFLSVGVPAEIALNLAHRRGIAVRPFAETRKLDLTKLTAADVANVTSADAVIAGEVSGSGQSPLVRLRGFDRATGDFTWRDSIELNGQRLIALQQQVSQLVHTRIARRFKAELEAPNMAPAPRNEEAYRLFLLAVREQDGGKDIKRAIAKLERSVALDSMYPPAWFQLGMTYYAESRYYSGDPTFMRKARAANEKAFRLNPEYVEAGAANAIADVELGDVAGAYRAVRELLRRRPDVAELHFVASYALRFAGLLEESSRECQSALSLTRWRLRSCAVPFILRGDYEASEGFLSLDRELDFHRALRIHGLVRAGREREALAIARPDIPQWRNYDVLLACAARRTKAEVDSLAALVKPHDDPESNYFAASHMAYCGREDQALDLLGRAITGGYCSYPVLETDPYFAKLRSLPAFEQLRRQGRACQERFLAAVGS